MADLAGPHRIFHKERVPKVLVPFKPPNGTFAFSDAVNGKLVYIPTGNKVDGKYEYKWSGEVE